MVAEEDFITQADRERIYEQACTRLDAAIDKSMPKLPDSEQRELSAAITDAIIAAAGLASSFVATTVAREEKTDP